jgi:NitT/TauT family transport system substrate-binding protein
MSSPRPPARGRFNTWIVLLATIVILVVVALLALGNRGPGASPSASPSRSKTSEPTATSSPSGSPASPGASSTATGTTQLTVGLGYIPNVQFAPFYLANQAGYYEDAGLQVTFENKIDPDLITLVGQGSIDIGLADGTSMIPAVSQGIPVRYLATVYRAFPSIVFTKTSSGITKAADLKGKKLGIPGRYGSSWIMLQALLKSANLTPDDLQIVEYPDFGQAAAVQQGAVDAATGFVNNEPVQLKEDGVDVRVLTVDQFVPLPGPGLIAGTKTLESKRDAIAAFISATLKAMRDVAADPQQGLQASVDAVPELGQNPKTQAAVLAATIAAWKGSGDESTFGQIDRDAWQKSIDFMSGLGLVPNPVTVDGVVDPSLLGG